MLKASEELRLCADAHEMEVITKDSYELKALLQADPNIEYIVDIGGNIGCFSIMASDLFPKAKVIMCEPEPELMKYAKENLEGKGIIFVEKACIGDPNVKEVTFNICKWQGNHHVDGRFAWENYRPVGSEQVGAITVKAITLKQMVDDNQFPRIDLLKIDTEGAEPEILESIKPWLKNVRHIAVEWHSQKDLARVKDALWNTHSMVITEGAFKEPSGATANGNIVATLKKNGEPFVAPILIKYQGDPQNPAPLKAPAAKSSCCQSDSVFENGRWYCRNCHRYQPVT